jgi:hypothetical protein
MIQYNDWCNAQDMNVGAHGLRVLSGDPAHINIGIAATAAVVPDWSRRAISRSQNSARCQRARKFDSPANVVLAALSFVDAGGEALRDAEAVLDFAQGEQPAVGAQVPGIEPGDDRLAADR